jgi:hypothetical protein
MDRVRPVTGAVTALMTAGLLAACGGEDNPISRDNPDRPPASSSSSPAPSSSPSVSASPSTSAAPTAGAPVASTPPGVLVQGSGFTVRLPGQPEKSSESAEGRITFDIYRYETDTATYTVTRGNYPKLGTLPTLHDAITSAAGQADGKLTGVHELKYRHEPGIEGVITGVKLDGKDVTIFARYVVVDRVMYGLLYLDRGASPTMTSAFREFAESLTF